MTVLRLPIGTRARRAYAVLSRAHKPAAFALAVVEALESAARESNAMLATATLMRVGYTAQNAADLLEQLGYVNRDALAVSP